MGVLSREIEVLGDGVEVTRIKDGSKYSYDRVVNFSIGLQADVTCDTTAVKEVEKDKEDSVGLEKKKKKKQKKKQKGEHETQHASSNGVGKREREEPSSAKTKASEEVKYIPLAQGGAAEGEEGASSSDEEQFENDVPLDSFSLPWEASCRRIYSPLLRMHQEIMEFTQFLEPTEEEEQARIRAINRIKGVILTYWPHAQVEVFGSFATGLYLPTSDIDMVILNSNCVDARAALRKLAGKISQQKMAKNMLVLSKARVPIVKFDDAETNLKFDISFDIDGGPETANFIKNMISKLPQMKPLVMILKIFLQQRELNEVYSGGVGSYALIIMVSVLLMTHESRLQKSKKVETCLGVLLIDFFDLYGYVLNMYEVGISCRKGGFFYNKRDFGFYSHERPYLLSIEDPRDTTSDIGKNSFNIQKLRSAFQFAATHLKAPENEFGELLLMRIIRMDTLLIRRLDQYHQRMEKLRKTRRNEPPQSLPSSSMQFHRSKEDSYGTSRGRSKAPMSKHEKMDIMGVVSISSSDEEGELSVDMSGEEGEFSDGNDEVPVNKKMKKF